MLTIDMRGYNPPPAGEFMVPLGLMTEVPTVGELVRFLITDEDEPCRVREARVVEYVKRVDIDGNADSCFLFV